MKALVVYESMFGNTAAIAKAIVSGLRETMNVDLHEVQDAPTAPSDDIDLIVAGGPTHAFSMSRTATRTDAMAKGAIHGKVDFGLREWLDGIPAGHHAASLATFDTRVTKVRHLPGSAARSAAKVGHKHGFTTGSSPESFYVEDIDGPLHEGELERATAWGRELGALVAAS
ncbi:flavodoxin/nitric oxide synthase [Aeromicrobium sp. 9AM]|uniref:flavodoxin family protein n=1 Tax=Aeromicrobium sp. 9AM TaxID=2653126 RepID=UPI0012F06DCE|nr:flavodoxin/nitric oxide synthase [Aeromicrobium sp. 9AM]VXC12541.1 conserved hypothetical protein [Aeromicrobium sp. 9AM]